MAEWLIATCVAVAMYLLGMRAGARVYSRALSRALQAGRSPAARAMRAALDLSAEHDR